MHSSDGMDDRLPCHRHRNHVLACQLHALLDGGRHLLGFAIANAHPALTIADGNKSGEREATTALYDFGDAIDRNDALVEFGAGVDSAADVADLDDEDEPAGEGRP